jgi:hypothetical protein
MLRRWQRPRSIQFATGFQSPGTSSRPTASNRIRSLISAAATTSSCLARISASRLRQIASCRKTRAASRSASNAPCIGSTLGSTGIGISKRCAVTPEPKNHLLWLMSTEAQTSFIPAHDGQPGRRSTWAGASVNVRRNDFYRNAADTLEAVYVRLRNIAFHGMVPALLCQAFNERRAAGAILDGPQALYRTSRRKTSLLKSLQLSEAGSNGGGR